MAVRPNHVSAEGARTQIRAAAHLSPVTHDGNGYIGSRVTLLFRKPRLARVTCTGKRRAPSVSNSPGGPGVSTDLRITSARPPVPQASAKVRPRISGPASAQVTALIRTLANVDGIGRTRHPAAGNCNPDCNRSVRRSPRARVRHAMADGRQDRTRRLSGRLYRRLPFMCGHLCDLRQADTCDLPRWFGPTHIPRSVRASRRDGLSAVTAAGVPVARLSR